MSFTRYLIGSAILLHAGYSSFEFHSLLKTTHHSASQTLPSDIIIEAIIGIIVLVFSAILSTANPNFLSIDNKEIKPEHSYLKAINMREATAEYEKLKINPYEDLDNRIDFIDVLKKREEYSKWVGETKEI